MIAMGAKLQRQRLFSNRLIRKKQRVIDPKVSFGASVNFNCLMKHVFAQVDLSRPISLFQPINSDCVEKDADKSDNMDETDDYQLEGSFRSMIIVSVLTIHGNMCYSNRLFSTCLFLNQQMNTHRYGVRRSWMIQRKYQQPSAKVSFIVSLLMTRGNMCHSHKLFSAHPVLNQQMNIRKQGVVKSQMISELRRENTVLVSSVV